MRERLLATGRGKRFAGKQHLFQNVTDRPFPTVVESRPLEVIIERIEDGCQDLG